MEVEINRTVKIDITKEDFEDYERIRESGITNMFDIKRVRDLSKGLTLEKIKAIIKNYNQLIEEFSSVRR